MLTDSLKVYSPAKLPRVISGHNETKNPNNTSIQKVLGGGVGEEKTDLADVNY